MLQKITGDVTEKSGELNCVRKNEGEASDFSPADSYLHHIGWRSHQILPDFI